MRQKFYHALKSSNAFALVGIMALGAAIAYAATQGLQRQVNRRLHIQDVKGRFELEAVSKRISSYLANSQACSNTLGTSISNGKNISSIKNQNDQAQLTAGQRYGRGLINFESATVKINSGNVSLVVELSRYNKVAKKSYGQQKKVFPITIVGTVANVQECHLTSTSSTVNNQAKKELCEKIEGASWVGGKCKLTVIETPSPTPGKVFRGFAQTGVLQTCDTQWKPVDYSRWCVGETITQSNECGASRSMQGTTPSTWLPDPATKCRPPHPKFTQTEQCCRGDLLYCAQDTRRVAGTKCCLTCNNPWTLNSSACQCECNKVCSGDYVRDPDPNECQCICNKACPSGFTRNNSTCTCECNKICSGDYIRDPSPNKCECKCNKTCPTNFTRNDSTCTCECNKVCPTNFTKNTTNCTCECNKVCPQGHTLNPSTCVCEQTACTTSCGSEFAQKSFPDCSCYCNKNCGTGKTLNSSSCLCEDSPCCTSSAKSSCDKSCVEQCWNGMSSCTGLNNLTAYNTETNQCSCASGIQYLLGCRGAGKKCISEAFKSTHPAHWCNKTAADCTGATPDLHLLTCSCRCSKTCAADETLDYNTCTCGKNIVQAQTTCSTSCGSGFDQGAYPGCACTCNKSCGVGYTLDSNTCTCKCNKSCGTGYTLNPSACTCHQSACTNSCPTNYDRSAYPTCACTCNKQCSGGFTLDLTDCSCKCNKSAADCSGSEVFDAANCLCSAGSCSNSCPTNFDRGAYPGCACTCNKNCTGGFALNLTDCTCNCNRTCSPGYVLDPANCTCTQNACTNSCPANFDRSAYPGCACNCNQNCSGDYALDSSTCTCNCNKQCSSEFSLDTDTCSCVCNKQCSADETLDPSTCTCAANTCSNTCPSGFTLGAFPGCSCDCKKSANSCPYTKPDLHAGTCSCRCNKTDDNCAVGQVLDPSTCTCKTAKQYQCKTKCGSFDYLHTSNEKISALDKYYAESLFCQDSGVGSVRTAGDVCSAYQVDFNLNHCSCAKYVPSAPPTPIPTPGPKPASNSPKCNTGFSLDANACTCKTTTTTPAAKKIAVCKQSCKQRSGNTISFRRLLKYPSSCTLQSAENSCLALGCPNSNAEAVEGCGCSMHNTDCSNGEYFNYGTGKCASGSAPANRIYLGFIYLSDGTCPTTTTPTPAQPQPPAAGQCVTKKMCNRYCSHNRGDGVTSTSSRSAYLNDSCVSNFTPVSCSTFSVSGLVNFSASASYLDSKVKNICLSKLQCATTCTKWDKNNGFSAPDWKKTLYPASKKTVSGREIFYCPTIPSGKTKNTLCTDAGYKYSSTSLSHSTKTCNGDGCTPPPPPALTPMGQNCRCNSNQYSCASVCANKSCSSSKPIKYIFTSTCNTVCASSVPAGHLGQTNILACPTTTTTPTPAQPQPPAQTCNTTCSAAGQYLDTNNCFCVFSSCPALPSISYSSTKLGYNYCRCIETVNEYNVFCNSGNTHSGTMQYPVGDLSHPTIPEQENNCKNLYGYCGQSKPHRCKHAGTKQVFHYADCK